MKQTIILLTALCVLAFSCKKKDNYYCNTCKISQYNYANVQPNYYIANSSQIGDTSICGDSRDASDVTVRAYIQWSLAQPAYDSTLTTDTSGTYYVYHKKTIACTL